MAFIENWVETDPDGSIITVSVLDDWIRKTKLATRERMEGDAALNLTGLIDAGTWSTGPVPKAGSARASVVTAANLGTVPLQDGRMAITSDTQRLYHMKGTGYVELDYLSKTAGGTVAGATTFSAAMTATSAVFSGNVTAASFTGVAAATAGTLTGTVLAANVVTSSLTSVGTLISLGVTGTVTAGAFSGPLTGNLTGTVLTAAQGNITSLGALTSLLVSGASSFGSNGGAESFRSKAANGNFHWVIENQAGSTTWGSYLSGAGLEWTFYDITNARTNMILAHGGQVLFGTTSITGVAAGGIGVAGASRFDSSVVMNGGNSALILVNGATTGYTSSRWYNDQNNGLRALEIDYSGSAYASSLVTGGPSGESASITTTGAYPLSIGTNNAARIIFGSAGAVTANGAWTFNSTVSGITTLTATTINGTLATAAQGNITSVGTLASLTVTGLITANGGLTVTGAFGGLTATTLGAPNTQFTLAATFAGAGCPVTVSAAQAKWLPITGSDALVYYVPAWR